MNTHLLRLKTALFILFISFGLSLSATLPLTAHSYFEHLSEINKEWHYHKEACPQGTISFESDLDRIQMHLHLVIEHLRSNIPKQFSEKQKENRLSLLDQLHDYADQKVFPINKYHTVRTPYFVDHLGTNCAVGQMIYVSGHEDLVAKISKEHNYDFIRDIHTEGLVEWANEFGFTVEELKWIQPMYSPQRIIDQVEEGTNGPVNKMVRDAYAGTPTIVITGDFTELDDLPCLNVGVYKNEQLSCLGDGVEGTINDVVAFPSATYITGELIHNGQVYPVAKYDGSWTFIEIPNRSGAIGSVIFKGGYENQYEVVINHDSTPGKQEIWQLLINNTWEKLATIDGFIADASFYELDRVYAGHFDSIYIDVPVLNTTQSIAANNIILKSSHSGWYTIDDKISDTINVVEYYNQTLYIGGTCSNKSEENNICISRYYNSVAQPLLLNQYGDESFSINAFAKKDNENKIAFGGSFYFESGMSYGNNIAFYNLSSNFIQPIGILDEPVNSLAYSINNDLYIGGDFQSEQGQPVNYLGRITSTVSTNNYTASENFKAYPNPFTSKINLEGIENGVDFSILQPDGRTVKSGVIKNEKISNLDGLPSGSYLLHIETPTGTLVRRVMK